MTASKHLGGRSIHSMGSSSTFEIGDKKEEVWHNSASSSTLESGQSLLRLEDFEVARTATMGEPLLAMSTADTKYAYQVR